MYLNDVEYPNVDAKLMEGKTLLEVRIRTMTPELRNALTVLSNTEGTHKICVDGISYNAMITYLGSNKFYIHK